MHIRKSWRACVISLGAAVLLASRAHALDLSTQVAFEIPPQALASALIEFSKQTQLQVMSQGVDLALRKAPGVKGTYSISEALDQLLEGTNLRYSTTGPNTIAVTAGEVGAASATGSSDQLRVAQTDSANPV